METSTTQNNSLASYIPSFVSAGTGLLGTIIGGIQNKKARESAEAMNAENIAMQKEMNDYQKELNSIAMQREDNAHQREARDLAKAGLSSFATMNGAGVGSLASGVAPFNDISGVTSSGSVGNNLVFLINFLLYLGN